MYSRLSVILAAGLLSATVASAQTTTPTPAPTPSAPPARSATPPAATTPAPAMKNGETSAAAMTDEEARKWVDKKVFSSDNKNLGEVASLVRDSSGKVTEMHVDIGGFLGIGETRVRLMPSQFKLSGDRVVLNMPAEQAKTLPKAAAK